MIDDRQLLFLHERGKKKLMEGNRVVFNGWYLVDFFSCFLVNIRPAFSNVTLLGHLELDEISFYLFVVFIIVYKILVIYGSQ